MEEFEPFDGKLVRLEVGPDGYAIEEVDVATAEEGWAEVRPTLSVLPSVDPINIYAIHRPLSNWAVVD